MNRVTTLSSLALHKAAFVTGTFDEGAFQLYVDLPTPNHETTTSSSTTTLESKLPSFDKLISIDPMPIALFDILGYHTVPHCGVYNQDDYEPSIPFVLIRLPFEAFWHKPSPPSFLPSSLLPHLNLNMPTTFLLMLHGLPMLKECGHLMCSSRREINLMFQAWALPTTSLSRATDAYTEVEMGLFGWQGVEPTHMDTPDQRYAGMPFDCVAPRAVIIVPNTTQPPSLSLSLSLTHTHTQL